jgi:hypothetical protein
VAEHNGPVPLSEAFPGTTWRIPEQYFPAFWPTLVTVASIPDPADHCICYTHLAHLQLLGYVFCLPVFWCPSEDKTILFSFIANICMQNIVNESPIVMWYFLNRTVLRKKKKKMDTIQENCIQCKHPLTNYRTFIGHRLSKSHIPLLVKGTIGTVRHTTCIVENKLVQKVPLG